MSPKLNLSLLNLKLINLYAETYALFETINNDIDFISQMVSSIIDDKKNNKVDDNLIAMYIQFSNLDLLIGTNPNEFTVSMWVKVEYDTPSVTSTYWGFYNGSTIRTRLWSSGGQTPYFVFQNSSGSNPALSLDSYKPSSNPTAWNHFLIAYDGINITFFRNGVKKSTYVAGESEHIGGYNFKIMYNSPDSNKIAYADEIAMWRRTLTHEEITQLYSLYI